MNTDTKADPRDLCNPNTLKPAVMDVMRKHWMDCHAHIVRDAKAEQLRLVREEWCRAYGVEKDEQSDDEGGGSITLVFPKGWTEDQATTFASDCLDMALHSSYGGAGRYFQDSGIGTNDDGIVSIGVRWGLDI